MLWNKSKGYILSVRADRTVSWVLWWNRLKFASLANQVGATRISPRADSTPPQKINHKTHLLLEKLHNNAMMDLRHMFSLSSEMLWSRQVEIFFSLSPVTVFLLHRRWTTSRNVTVIGCFFSCWDEERRIWWLCPSNNSFQHQFLPHLPDTLSKRTVQLSFTHTHTHTDILYWPAVWRWEGEQGLTFSFLWSPYVSCSTSVQEGSLKAEPCKLSITPQ